MGEPIFISYYRPSFYSPKFDMISYCLIFSSLKSTSLIFSLLLSLSFLWKRKGRMKTRWYISLIYFLCYCYLFLSFYTQFYDLKIFFYAFLNSLCSSFLIYLANYFWFLFLYFLDNFRNYFYWRSTSCLCWLALTRA